MKATGWLRGLEVTADGTGIVSHAGLALLRALAGKTGLTGGLSKALASDRLLVHDRGRVLADLACAIADGAEVISDFRVMGDQEELFGLVASVPTCWRALDEVAAGGGRVLVRITAAVNAARRRAWQAAVMRHGALPGVAIADRALEGMTCLRLDATVVACHSDKEGAEPNFKGFGLHPLGCWCDNTSEPLAAKLRNGSAGSNTTADHLEVLGAAITALPPKHRRRLMVTCDGAGASHGLIERLDKLAARPGHQLVYSVGWELGERERTAITAVPGEAWQIAIGRRGEVRERRAEGARLRRSAVRAPPLLGGTSPRHRADRTAALRPGRGPARRLACHHAHLRPPRAPPPQLTLFEAEDGWRYSLWVTNLPVTMRGWRANPAYIDAAHRVHARVEDCVRTGKDTGIGKFPAASFAFNQAWLAASLAAATLLAWLRLLAKAEPKTLRYRIMHAAARLTRSGRQRRLKIAATWPWAPAIVTAWDRITALPQAP